MGMKFVAIMVLLTAQGCALMPRVAPAGRDAEADCVDVWNRMAELSSQCGGRTDKWTSGECVAVMAESADASKVCMPALKTATCDTMANVWVTDCEDVFKFPP
jgi:hypothetical protein